MLEAAARLFARHGAKSVSMKRVAAFAGADKGTQLRRFGETSGPAAALCCSHQARPK
ncbi:TetR family transcriptional regulator [Streptomyces sp. NBC_01198]|uniref:TetR family transcriptional regulator n=1 Tax=Streptomyces sp. NBC_01198 TaxID=2903769 RepID=UPI002E1583D9